METFRRKINKKLIALSLISTLAFSIVLLSLRNTSFFDASAVVHDENCYFNHYEYTEPTEDMHGSKEFWACCTHGTFLLTNPEKGTIHETGKFQGPYFYDLTEEDERYIAPLPKTRRVKYYCDDYLLDSVLTKDGNKIDAVYDADFSISGWYKDKDKTIPWNFEEDVIDSDLDLYADYVVLERTLTATESNNLTIDDNGYGELKINRKEICISQGIENHLSLVSLATRGILFNKETAGYISELNVEISINGFESAKLYYGNNPLSFEHEYDLTAGLNTLNLENYEYFVLQNTGENNIDINSINFTYKTRTVFEDNQLPQVIINTKNNSAITSKTQYVGCTVSTKGATKDVDNLKAEIKIRGNSTALCPKKPYRIKLDKKNSLFGYTKAKNWVLLADYMDGSNMHSYTALKFTQMLKDNSSFCVNPMHVNLILNGVDVGLYEFAENIDEKEGRLNIGQDNLWEKSFDEINFYIERDLSTLQDSSEIEGETYFTVDVENYPINQYVFALKYPELSDFEEELEDGTTIIHSEEFHTFFNNLKTYITDICQSFKDYYEDSSAFELLSQKVDFASLAEYACIDQTFRETDHAQKSFKMYRSDGALLKFGPNWDYDSCAYGLPYKGTYVLEPYKIAWGQYESLYISDNWARTLYNDSVNGLPLFKNVWSLVTETEINEFIHSQLDEVSRISKDSIFDCSIWMNDNYSCLFDNITYYWTWINLQIIFLKTYYEAL